MFTFCHFFSVTSMSRHSVKSQTKDPYVIHEAVHWYGRALFSVSLRKLAATALPYHMLHSHNATLVSFQTSTRDFQCASYLLCLLHTYRVCLSKCLNTLSSRKKLCNHEQWGSERQGNKTGHRLAKSRPQIYHCKPIFCLEGCFLS